MKVRGAELIAFLKEEWPDGWCHEGIGMEERDPTFLLYTAEGVHLNPAEKYDFDDFGYITWMGAPDSAPTDHPYLREGDSIEQTFKRWRKWITTQLIVIELPKDADLGELIETVEALRGRVLK